MNKKTLVILLAMAILLAGAKKKDEKKENKSKQNQEQAAQPSEKQKAKSGLAFVHIFGSEIKGVFLAKSTGEVMVHGDEWVEYFDSEGRQLWKKEGFKYVGGGGVSRDGQTVLFQTSEVPKTQQTTLDLKVHVVDRTGNESINQPNPYKYFTSILSPKGNYILFGDPLYKMIYAYDRNLTLQWQRETYLWYIYFDPDEQLVYDSAGGMILNSQGKRVWELPSGAKFLSVSSGAEILLSQRFLSAKGRNQIYLTSRTTAQEVLLEGWCAGVSYDGSLTAYEDMDRKVRVYRTKELFDKMTGGAEAKPIWTGDFYLAKQIQFSWDNSRLFIYGETMQQSGRVEIIDLAKTRQAWEKDWTNPPTFVSASEDTRTMVFASGASLEYYKPR